MMEKARVGACALAAWVLVLATALAGCGGGEPETETPPPGAPPTVVTTLPPVALVVRPLVEPRGAVAALVPAGASPHAYEPRPSDVRRAAEAALLVYVADALDGWAADLPARRRLALASLVPDSLRLTFGGEGAASEHAHGGFDPHVWTDPVAVRALLPALADTLCAADPAGCPGYAERAGAFAARLDTLDAALRRTLAPVAEVPVMLAQPFYRYPLARYGPRLVAVVEPRPGSEPSPRRLQALVRQAEREGVRVILTQAQLPPRAAEAVAEAAGLPVVRLDPLGTAADTSSYAALLLRNAQTLRRALADTAAADALAEE